MKNVYSLAIACLFACLSVHVSFSQEKVWFTSSSVAYCNTDGTDITASTDFSEPVGGSHTYYGSDADYLMQASTGDIFAVTTAGGVEDFGTIVRISKTGIQKVTDLGYNMQNAYMTEGKDGYIYGVKPSAFDYYIFRFKLDGTGHQDKYIRSYGMREGPLTTSLTGDILGTNVFYLYKINADLSGITRLYTYQKATGNAPIGKLHQSNDGYLYGATRLGGAGNYGVVYRVKPDGTDYKVLHEFNITNGRYPDRGLSEDANGYLYGITREGGKYKLGVLFRIRKDGSAYEILHHFATKYEFTDDELPNSIQIDKLGNLYGSPPWQYGREMFRFEMATRTYSTPISGDMTIRDINIFQPVSPVIEVLRPANGATNVLVNDTHRVTFIPGSLWYQVQFSTVPDFSAGVLTSTYPTSSNLPKVNLAYSTKYYARAKSSLWPYYGKTISFTTRSAESYGFITNPKDGSVNVETQNLKVTGNLVPYAKRYTLQLSPTPDFSAGVITKVSAIDFQRTLVFTDLAYSTKYYARMKTDISGYGRVTSFTTKADQNAVTTTAARESTFDVHPNPSSDLFNVTLRSTATSEAHVVMMKLTGEIVEEHSVQSGEVTQLGQNLERGIYLLKIRTANGVEVRRVVKE
jgi:uncharacterized repeat protein (TIGR03803 family)